MVDESAKAISADGDSSACMLLESVRMGEMGRKLIVQRYRIHVNLE